MSVKYIDVEGLSPAHDAIGRQWNLYRAEPMERSEVTGSKRCWDSSSFFFSLCYWAILMPAASSTMGYNSP